MWFENFSSAAAKTADSEIIENGRPVPSKGRNYVFTDELVAAIDVAVGLGRPLLVSGEPGCGKTELGYAVARRMGIPRLHFFSTKSNSESRDLFYTYDALSRFRDAQSPLDAGKGANDVADYIEFQALGRAILDAHEKSEVAHLLRGRRAYAHAGQPERSVVIIDEIDKASRDFPNDLLREIEDLSFAVPEMGGKRDGADGKVPETPGNIPASRKPIIIITSNEERQLPDAFLRRCVFHEISFPNDEVLGRIIASGLDRRLPPNGEFALPEVERAELTKLLGSFRALPLDKRPGISELIDAAALLAYPAGEAPPLPDRLRRTVPALAKLRNDRQTLAQLIEEQLKQRS